MEKKTNKGKLEIFKIFENISFIAFAKIGSNYALSGNSTKICLKGIFACRIHICDENSSKSYDFREKCKKI